VPNAPANLGLTGTGADRTITVTPAVNRFGAANIAIAVSDDVETATNAFLTTVTSVNDAPIGLTLSKRTVLPNQVGAVVGQLTVIDPDPNETFTFSLSDSRFEVIANGTGGYTLKLKANQALNPATANQVPLTITVTDSGLEAYEQSFTIVAGGANDFTGDGRADIVWRNQRTGENVIWEMNGTNILSIKSLPTVGDLAWQVEETGDFNNDGWSDIVWRNYRTGENVIWQMNGTTLVAIRFLISVSDLNWNIEGVGDFNGDGTTDIYWRNYRTGENVIWQMNGFNYQGLHFVTPVGDTNWRIARVGDFNGDGRADIVWYNQADGEVRIWEMGNTGLAPQRNIAIAKLTDTNWQLVGATDLSGNGKLDLVWRNRVFGYNTAWFAANGANPYLFPTNNSLFTVADLDWQLVV
jgi:VCBS repeat-containing protein